MDQPQRVDTTRGAMALALLANLLVACESSHKPIGSSRLILGSGNGSILVRSPDGTVSRDASLRLTIDPLPAIDTDGFLLPLVSPNGTHLAWQSQSTADWPTLLAQPDSTKHLQATVSGRPLNESGTWTQTEMLLLGRMATDKGVLVESPRSDGSRWIGMVPWDGSTPRWLVQGEHVNAFAALGPRGELAWCRRNPMQAEFGLVIERPEGRLEWPRREGESWLMPVVTPDGVYACSLRDGILELVFLPLAAGQSLTTSQAEPALLRNRISMRGSPRAAFQTFAACSADRSGTRAGLLFFHPELRRMVLWNPFKESMIALAPESVSAWIQPDGSALLTLKDRLVMQEIPPEPGMVPLHMIPGLWIVRGRDANGFILIGPADPKQCLVSRLRLGDKQTLP